MDPAVLDIRIIPLQQTLGRFAFFIFSVGLISVIAVFIQVKFLELLHGIKGNTHTTQTSIIPVHFFFVISRRDNLYSLRPPLKVK